MIRWTVAFTILALLGLVSPALAVFPPPIKDDGKFFTKDGTEKANTKIRSLYENYKKDVIVETLGSLTEEQEKKLKDEDKTKFFGKLANARAKELGLNGIYILLSKKPQFLFVYMDPQTQKKAFTNANRNATKAKLVAQLKEDKFDAAIEEALAEIESILKANAK